MIAWPFQSRVWKYPIIVVCAEASAQAKLFIRNVWVSRISRHYQAVLDVDHKWFTLSRSGLPGGGGRCREARLCERVKSRGYNNLLMTSFMTQDGSRGDVSSTCVILADDCHQPFSFCRRNGGRSDYFWYWAVRSQLVTVQISPENHTFESRLWKTF